jgi:hypothetical protein
MEKRSYGETEETIFQENEDENDEYDKKQKEGSPFLRFSVFLTLVIVPLTP